MLGFFNDRRDGLILMGTACSSNLIYLYLGFYSSNQLDLLGTKMIAQLTILVFHKVLSIHPRDAKKLPIGKVINILSNDVEGFSGMIWLGGTF